MTVTSSFAHFIALASLKFVTCPFLRIRHLKPERSRKGRVRERNSSPMISADEVSQTWRQDQRKTAERHRVASLGWALYLRQAVLSLFRTGSSTHLILSSSHPWVRHGTKAMGSHRLPLTQLCHLLAVPSARAGLLEQLFKMQVSIESSG